MKPDKISRIDLLTYSLVHAMLQWYFEACFESPVKRAKLASPSRWYQLRIFDYNMYFTFNLHVIFWRTLNNVCRYLSYIMYWKRPALKKNWIEFKNKERLTAALIFDKNMRLDTPTWRFFFGGGGGGSFELFWYDFCTLSLVKNTLFCINYLCYVSLFKQLYYIKIMWELFPWLMPSLQKSAILIPFFAISE